MTRFCVFEGTAPQVSKLERALRRLRGSPNDIVCQRISTNDILGLAREVETSERDVNDSFLVDKWVNSRSTCWRTPLEWAVDRGVSPEVVVYLLEKGAHITPATLKLAVNGAMKDWISAREQSEFDRAESIIEVLSAAGADWSQAFFEPEGSRGREKFTPAHIIEKLGQARAAQIGITQACIPTPLTRSFTQVEDFVNAKKANQMAGALDHTAPAAPSTNPPTRRF